MSDFSLEKNFFCELLEKVLYDESVWPVLATCSRQKLNAFFVCDSHINMNSGNAPIRGRKRER